MHFQNSNIQGRILEDSTKVKDLTLTSIDGILESIVAHLPLIVAGIIVFVVFILISKGVTFLFLAGTSRTRLDARLRILFGRLIGMMIVTIGFFTALTVFTKLELSSLIAGLGFSSFVIGFATKDILNNLLSGVLILWQQPFRIGDYLFVGNNEGKVEHIGVRATQLRKDDGELVLIPNGDMYSSAVTIRGAGAERRMQLKILIGYDSDIDIAKKIIADDLATTAGVVEEPHPRVVVTDLTGDGVNISIYFWINTDRDKPIEVFDAVATNIKKALEKGKIDLFPPGGLIAQNPGASPTEVDSKLHNGL